jgi:hypothetical protein
MKNIILSFIIGVSICFAAPVQAEESRYALLSELKGQVTVRQNEAEWKPALQGMTLQEKDEIRTGPGGYAEILMDGGDVARLELRENSYFKLHTMGYDAATGDKATLLDLAIGKVLVHAEKLKSDSKFEVRTPTSTTGVRGTVFEVQVEEKVA